MKRVYVFMLCIGILLSSEAYGGPYESVDIPSLISSLDISAPVTLCEELVPIHNQEVRERFEKELMLSLWDRPQVILWLKRSRRYLPHIEKMLKEEKLPDDLKYVAIAESALRPHVASGRGAVGFWQFMPGTGRKYGLRIDRRIDERRNIFASTGAAILYFQDLHETFGSWTLAVAAFNMGEEGLMAEILEQGTQDYYQLYLSIETQRFIFRVLSVKLIFSDPQKYGFGLTDKDYYPPLAFDRVQVACSQDIPIRVIAKAAKTHFKMIKDLNPEIRGHSLGKGSHPILIPKGASEGFEDRYQSHVETFLADKRDRIYIVKEGDNLSVIAERFNVPLAALIIWNRLDPRRPIYPGDRLVIYPNHLKPAEAGENEEIGEGETPFSGEQK